MDINENNAERKFLIDKKSIWGGGGEKKKIKEKKIYCYLNMLIYVIWIPVDEVYPVVRHDEVVWE